MEQDNESRSTLQSQSPFLLGFFFQPHFRVYKYPSDYGYSFSTVPSAEFISTSVEAEDLNEGKWGALDASLSFLNQIAHIVGSSNGFLLCNTDLDENMNYIICNPVTREVKILPEPHRVYQYVAIAFICKGDGISLDRLSYEVIRAGVSNPMEQTRILEIETFSSETGEWKESSIVSTTPFGLVVGNLPAFVVEEVIYWMGSFGEVVAYDPAKESVEVIELPRDTQNLVCKSECLSQSEGKIYYARVDICYLEVWILDDYHRAQWSMKHRVRLTTMIQQNPETGRAPPTTGVISVRYLHPCNSLQVLLLFSSQPFWYNLESGKVKKISRPSHVLLCRDFLYEWPPAALYAYRQAITF